MKNGLLKSFSLILALCMLLTSMSIVIVASDISKLDIIGGNVELDLTNEGNVTVSVVAKEELTFYGIQGSFDVKEQGETNYFTLTGITSECFTFNDSEGSFADVETGDLMWYDATFTSSAKAAGTKILTATYKVAANTPDGEYTVRYTSSVFTGATGDPDETETVFEAKITVTHKCKLEAQPDQAAKCEADGWKTYYKCTYCGKFYADAAATEVIADVEAWKLADGKLPATNHKDSLKKTDATPVLCETPGNSEYYTCTVCGKFFSDAEATTEIEKDSWIIGATDHKWSTPAYTNNGNGTHTATYTCGNNAEHTYSDAPATHVYVEGFCVCGADESLAGYMKGDVNLDGEIDSQDLTILARHIAKIEYITDLVALDNADINGDDGISSEDLTKLARHVAKIEYIS